LDLVPASSPADVAYAVVRGAGLRQRAVYYPYIEARVLPLAYQLFPWPFDKMSAWLYARN